MSCRSSPDSRRRQNLASGGVSKRTSTVEGLPLVKTEQDVDMKDYAETAMNELLGWYGYDKVNTGDARNLSLRTSSSSSSSPQRTDGTSPKSRAGDISDEVSEREGSSRDTGGTGTPVLDVESVASNSTNGNIMCAWCLKNGLKLFSLKTAGGQTKAFCSELCFDQCRRAAFKKNRVCDWCKHVRHTVNYVDFQDKERQLQFCSDKCLNQYKMNIFCKETQAYLQMHPHLQDTASSKNSASHSSNLITPDLWLRDCKESVNGSLCSSDDESGAVAESSSPSYVSDVQSSSKIHTAISSKSSYKEPVKTETALPATEHSTGSSSLLKQNEKVSFERNSLANRLLKLDAGGLNEGLQKKNHFGDRGNLFRSERSLRMRSSLPESLSRNTISPATHSLSKHFFDQRMYGQFSPPPTYPPPPLINGSVAPKHHSSSSLSTSMCSATNALPPPPPLLNSDMLHAPLLHPHMYHQQPLGLLEQQQQQLEALLTMQNSLGTRMGMLNQRPAFPETTPLASPLNLSTATSMPNPLLPPAATVMLPYPLIIPLPFPIPIPIPIPPSSFTQVKQTAEKSKSTTSMRTNNVEEQAKRVDNIITRLITKHQGESNQEHDATSQKSSREAVTADSVSEPKRTRTTQECDTVCLVPTDTMENSHTEQSSRTRNKRSSVCSSNSIYKERTKRVKNNENKL